MSDHVVTYAHDSRNAVHLVGSVTSKHTACGKALPLDVSTHLLVWSMLPAAVSCNECRRYL